MKATRELQNATGVGNADGGTIYLTAGDHVYGSYSFSLLTTNIESLADSYTATGLTKDQVRLVGAGTADGLRTKLVKVQGLTVAPATAASITVLRSQATMEDYLWLDGVDVIGLGRTIDGSVFNGWTSSYVTNSSIRAARDGFLGADSELCCNRHRVGRIFRQWANRGLDGVQYRQDWHGLPPRRGSILRRARECYHLRPDCDRRNQRTRAFHRRKSGSQTAFVKPFGSSDACRKRFPVFQFGGETEHLYIVGSTFTGPAAWHLIWVSLDTT